MKNILKISFVLFLWLMCQYSIMAQSENRELISGLFLGISFERFVAQVESNTSYRFYYKSQDILELRVNMSAENNSLSDILSTLFSNTELKFFIDDNQNVYITKGVLVNNTVHQGFKIPSENQNIPLEGQAEIAQQTESTTLDRNTLWEIGSTETHDGSGYATLSGVIQAKSTREPISGALVTGPQISDRIVSDQNGKFSVRLPLGRQSLVVQGFGLGQERRSINVMGDGGLNITMEEDFISLGEVTVSSNRPINVEKVQMGVETMDISTMKKMPLLLGEVDVIRSILTLPGVNTVGEASVGFNVRGGAADQNLILYNEATIFNPSHLFGFFSAFNPDMVNGVDLYKTGIPIQYGGRLSSVLDVEGKYGNAESIQGGGGIGLLASRLNLEGPIGKNTTFNIGGRTTYSNWLLSLLDETTGFNNGRASFYDINLNLSHQIDGRNKLLFTGYLSGDSFRFERDTTFSYSNRNLNLSWIREQSDELSFKTTIGYDGYEFNIISDLNPSNSFDFGFDINQFHFKSLANYTAIPNHKLNFGVSSILFSLNPGTISPKGTGSLILDQRVDTERALESAIFINDEWELSDRFSLSLGARLMFYQFLGPTDVDIYQEGTIRTAETVVETISYSSNEIVQPYFGPEFRIFGRYLLNENSSIKAGFSSSRQHLHMVTNTSAIAPTDTWKLSDRYVRPQIGNQVSAGYFTFIPSRFLEASFEVFYRTMDNLLDYRSGATLILNNAIERDILRTEGQAYGIEVLLKKNVGRLNGWLSYTYSRSLLRTSPDELGQKINMGRFYPSNFDQPHDVFLVLNYEITKRVMPAITANYSTGRPITLPIAKFDYLDVDRVFFSDRNAFRIPDFFRIDASVNFEGNHKIEKLAHSSWSIGVYNLLGRSNPYSAYFTPINGTLQGFQLSIFARPIPFITYNFRF